MTTTPEALTRHALTCVSSLCKHPLEPYVESIGGGGSDLLEESRERTQAGNYLCLTIRVAGIGIDARAEGSIFDPFFSTQHTGCGLGLSRVLAILRSHKGGLRIDSGGWSVQRPWTRSWKRMLTSKPGAAARRPTCARLALRPAPVSRFATLNPRHKPL